MPRDYSQADRHLAQKLGVEPRQMERWRSEGCLQPPEWLHQPGMPGSLSAHPAGAAKQAARVRDLLAERPGMFAGPRMSFNEVRVLLFWENRFVDEVKLRASYLAFLDRLNRPLTADDVKDAMDVARVLCGQPGGGVRQWTRALTIANTVARAGGADPAARIELALAVLLTLLFGGKPSSDLPGGPDDLVADAIDNLGFGADETVAAGDLAFLDLGVTRGLIERANYAELEHTRDMTNSVMGYANTLAYIGSRTVDQREHDRLHEQRVTGAVKAAEKLVEVQRLNLDALEGYAGERLAAFRAAQDKARAAAEYARQQREAYDRARGDAGTGAEEETGLLIAADAADETAFQAGKAAQEREAESQEADRDLAEVRDWLAGAAAGKLHGPRRRHAPPVRRRQLHRHPGLADTRAGPYGAQSSVPLRTAGR